MEIEVIQDKYKYRYVECPYCESKLKITKDTIAYYYSGGYDIADVNCPCCNKKFRMRSCKQIRI